MDSSIVLKLLYDIGSLQFGKFVLASGDSSEFYLDLRLIPSYPRLFEDFIKKLKQKIEKLDFDIIIGIPSAGVPFATYLAILTKKPLVQIRKISKDHGLKKKLEGISIKGKKVLLVDDLITSGFSKVFAIQTVREQHGKVDSIVVLVDRREDKMSHTKFEIKYKINVISLFKLTSKDILDFKHKSLNIKV